MKFRKHHIAILIVLVTVISCKKDNYDAPGSRLSGHVVYKGEPIEVEYDQVPFELYQYGFGKTGPISAVFAPDGSYSMLLFNGDYKFIIPNGQGPFQWKQTMQGTPDTMDITLSGSQELDIEVTPYYMIRNPQLTASGGQVSGTFNIEKIITGASARDVENVSLYINKTQFVSGANNVAVKTVSGADITNPNNVVLGVTIPTLTPAQGYIYARIGLKITGVEDRIFSPVKKINL
jgi:hypothetical protein